MNEALISVVEEYGTLKRVVVDEFNKDWIDSISFQFENGVLDLSVDLEYDTIRWAVQAQVVGESGSSGPFWSSLLSSKPAWIWLLENQRGYLDGIQIEFWLGNQRTLLQIAAETAQLKIYRLEQIVAAL
ncbi:MAG: DUF6334 family protein [Pseudolysinimonas sp.]